MRTVSSPAGPDLPTFTQTAALNGPARAGHGRVLRGAVRSAHADATADDASSEGADAR